MGQKSSGIKPVRLLNHILQFYFTFLQKNSISPSCERMFIRCRALFPGQAPQPVCRAKRRCRFVPRRVGEVVSTPRQVCAAFTYLHRIRGRVERYPRPYSDAALTPIDSELQPTRRKEGMLTGAAA
jgi:hypothetical protein